MTEMACACEDHRDSVLVARIDGLLVADRAARLNNGRDSGFVCRVNAVAEREISVGAENGTLRLFAGKVKGDLRGADPV